MVYIWDLVKPLVTWTKAEREQKLFAVCCQVQAELMARYWGYQTPTPHQVPEEVVEVVKEILREILPAPG